MRRTRAAVFFSHLACPLFDDVLDFADIEHVAGHATIAGAAAHVGQIAHVAHPSTMGTRIAASTTLLLLLGFPQFNPWTQNLPSC